MNGKKIFKILFPPLKCLFNVRRCEWRWKCFITKLTLNAVTSEYGLAMFTHDDDMTNNALKKLLKYFSATHSLLLCFILVASV